MKEKGCFFFCYWGANRKEKKQLEVSGLKVGVFAGARRVKITSCRLVFGKKRKNNVFFNKEEGKVLSWKVQSWLWGGRKEERICLSRWVD